MSPRVPGGMAAKVAALEAELAGVKVERARFAAAGIDLRAQRDAADRERDGVVDTLAEVQTRLEAAGAERDVLAAKCDGLRALYAAIHNNRDQIIFEAGIAHAFIPIGEIPALYACVRENRAAAASA